MHSLIDAFYYDCRYGVIIVRGSKCVLVRSVPPENGDPATHIKEWEGVRFPSAYPKCGETPHQTAVRAASEQCGIDDCEFFIYGALPPIVYYRKF